VDGGEDHCFKCSDRCGLDLLEGRLVESHTTVIVSRGFLARSESGVEPGYDKGGWGALRSLGIGLLLIWLILHCFFPEEARAAPSLRIFILA